MGVNMKKLPVSMQFKVSLCKNKLHARENTTGLLVGYQDTEELTSSVLIEVQLLDGGKLLTVPIDYCCSPDPIDVLAAIAVSSGR